MVSIPANQLEGIGLLLVTATTVYRRCFATHPMPATNLWHSCERLITVAAPGARTVETLAEREAETRQALVACLRAEGANGH